MVANGPAPIPAAFRKCHPDTRFIHEPRRGAAHARNAGVAQTKAEILILIDSDCTLDPATLRNAIALAPTADILGGDVRATPPQAAALTPAQAFEAEFAFDQARYIAKKGFSATACLVTKRDVFRQVGGFRHGLSEDLDWCHRATAMGFSLAYAPEIKVLHPCRDTWDALRRKWQRLILESYALKRESRVVWVAKACLMPASVVAHTPRVLTSRKLPAARDRLAALRMLAQLRIWRMAEMLRLSLQSRA